MISPNKIVFPTLYKMDSTGKIRGWGIQAIDPLLGNSFYEQTHGVKNGKLQTTSTEISKGKNIGKANETSAWEQCQLEAKSLWKKQKERRGYSETIPSEKPQMPMLAKSFKDDGHKIVWPAYCQPKLDGIRCIMSIDMRGNITLKSRQNKIFTSINHIADSWDGNDIQQWLGFSFDGELYNHDLHDDFQSLVSAIKRDKPSNQSSLIQYHIYDVCSNIDFKDRVFILQELTKFYINDFIKVVNTYIVQDHANFLIKYEDFIKDGYEGAMLRNAKGKYEFNKRSHNLQKHKEFFDSEFEIVDAIENKGKMSGECTFICITKDGAPFGVKPKGTSEQRAQMWQDFQAGKLTGKMMSVRFFEWTNSSPPVPRFPIGIAIRDYEE